MKKVLILVFVLFNWLSFSANPPIDIQAILKSGNGKTIQTAYEVNSVDEEYVVLDFLKLKSIGQKLFIKDGFFIDAIQTSTKTIYFKIIEKKLIRKINVLTT